MIKDFIVPHSHFGRNGSIGNPSCRFEYNSTDPNANPILDILQLYPKHYFLKCSAVYVRSHYDMMDTITTYNRIDIIERNKLGTTKIFEYEPCTQQPIRQFLFQEM